MSNEKEKGQSAKDYLQNKYPQMRGELWNSNPNINDEWIAEIMEEFYQFKESKIIKTLNEEITFHCVQLSDKEKEIEKHKDNYTAIAFEFEELESKVDKLEEAVSNIQIIVEDKRFPTHSNEYKIRELISEFKGKENTIILNLPESTAKELYQLIKESMDTGNKEWDDHMMKIFLQLRNRI